ncbi:CaiB/BaiF CoA-transferase family protein [Bordetella sp. BOR01]|uniref:CaiB/BaiF CoA transferase family protein n=1 Tax=Bordetella sp. BOR01 TaxID=2854779 RepID=UPI001C43CDBF|nr:CaiB/BaiF CoA-transferase family protein [Bordetella sp. BOR01]MBV7481686.1 CoA transferase [Bordetella sp. BOR01]
MPTRSAAATPGDVQQGGEAVRALDGVRVIDMARLLAGPLAAQHLADLGAEVVKIERPGEGDDSRNWEPSFESSGERLSAPFCAANRGKKSVTIDFARPDGAKLVQDLIADADVLIENYKTGTLTRYGLGYEQIKEINPRIVYCSITGFGQTGPYRLRAGYDTIMQAIGGLMSVTGERDGLPGAGPLRAGVPVIDFMTGIYGALAVVAALRQRDATGKGQYIDLALLDVEVSALSYFGVNYLASGIVPQRVGNSNPVTYPSGKFEASDGSIVLLIGNDRQFIKLCAEIGRDDLPADAQFATSPERVRNAARLDQIISPILASRESAHWVSALEARGVPCAQINDLKSVFEDPQVNARGNVARTRHARLGEIPLLTSPMRMTCNPISYDIAPPTLGEHNDEVLGHLPGMSAERLATLKASGVV